MLSSRAPLAALIAAATALFVVGVIVEKSTEDAHQQPPSAQAAPRPEQQAHGKSGADEHSESEASEGAHAESEATAHREADEQASEEILGVDPESTPLVVLAVIASLALAAAVVRWPRRPPLVWLAALAMLAFAALDVRELLHQLDENREGIAVLAGFVALLHGLAATVGARQARHGLAP